MGCRIEQAKIYKQEPSSVCLDFAQLSEPSASCKDMHERRRPHLFCPARADRSNRPFTVESMQAFRRILSEADGQRQRNCIFGGKKIKLDENESLLTPRGGTTESCSRVEWEEWVEC